MRALFPHKLYSQRFFCCRCQKVTAHDVCAQENYTTYGGLDSHIPLLCCCTKCSALFVTFSHELAVCRREDDGAEYAKIFGANRVFPGNWLYFIGDVKPNKVKSVFQASDKSIMVLDMGNGSEKKIECAKVDVDREDSPNGYRLLPAQSAHTLLGDRIFHTIREQYGTAVGMVNDGAKDKLAVLLDDKTLLFITIPAQAQNLPNGKLQAIVESKLKQIFPEDAVKVSVEVGLGIVYLKGFASSLLVKRNLVDCVNGLPKVRGCVDFTRIQTESYITDTQLVKAIDTLLESPNMPLFNSVVNVQGGRVDISASCCETHYQKELENRFAEIPGVIALHCSISVIPEDQMERVSLCREIETDLALNSRLTSSKIRVSCVNKKFILEGHVHSIVQKQLATFIVVKNAKTTFVDNRLKLQ